MFGILLKLGLLGGAGALAATELPKLLDSVNAGGQVVVTANDMELAKTLVIQFQLDNGRYPKTADLHDLFTAGIGGRQDPDKDRWGTPFQMGGKAKTPYLLSCGPDLQCGDEDDLKVYVAAIPEGETQVGLSERVQTNLLDKFKFKDDAQQ